MGEKIPVLFRFEVNGGQLPLGGKIDLDAADIYEKMLKTYIQPMTAMVEPILILFLGCIVGFVAFALISGILTMYKV